MHYCYELLKVWVLRGTEEVNISCGYAVSAEILIQFGSIQDSCWVPIMV
jgi:hypothetical protein